MSIHRSTNQPLWISAEDACRWLGIKKQTLYSYASRGQVMTRREGRRKWYRSADLAELETRAKAHAGRAPRAEHALHWGDPVLPTAISAIDADGPYYRGVSVLDLLDESLETVSSILWNFEVPWPRVEEPPVADLHALRWRVDALAVGDGNRADRASDSQRAATIAAIVRAAAAPRDHPDIETTLVLCADHGLNASTFTARVIASTGADLYAAVSGGLAALSGPRHGTVSLRLANYLSRFQEEGPAPILEAFDTHNTLPGFAPHRLYPQGDPRAEVLLQRARRHPEGPDLAAFYDLVALMASVGMKPNLDAGLLALCLALGEPAQQASLWFAAGRCVGWLAHIFEQRTQPGLLRPRSVFTGW